VVLNFVQTYRSHRVAERLRDAVAPTATALRDGNWTEIRRRIAGAVDRDQARNHD